ncbi:alpha/beta hydrolase [Zhengella mangrovi]|uniref:Alpha/beta hydrolase n=1 Tax=Zhengella mangrovi TaxID=1982044 RepID=A0A2G1QLJ3_9HYPH|nr:alpha/beta hydrolase [Zhengella mangrovi]PHP66372.1 alpha/beta hydrolase [Zhengella mangrovi]
MSRSFDTLSVDGIDIRLSQGSGGPALVMLHGIGSNASSFDGLSAALPEDWTLVAWNAPGYGGSRPLETGWPTAGAYADRLAEVAAALNLPPFLLAGHSLGTLMATAFAKRHPALVQGLVLLACAQGHGAAAGALGDKAQKRLDDLAARGTTEFARTRAPRLMFRPETMPEVRDRAIAAMAAINPDGYAQAVRMLATGDQASDAAGVRVPSLVMVGDKDVITPPAQSRGVHDALAEASPDQPHLFQTVPDAGHILHQEYPAAVADPVVSFAQQIAAAGEAVR